MHSDSMYVKGKSHKVCQDYAAHCDFGIVSHAAISDGCSSSKDTDVGARIIIHGELRKIFNAEEIFAYSGSRKDMFDATFLSIKASSMSATVSVVGDGAVAIREKDGALWIYEHSYPAGYPMYMSYMWDRGRYAQLTNDQREHVVTVKCIKDDLIMDEQDYYVSLQMIEEDDGIMVFPLINVESIAVFSDGVESFTDKEGNKIDCFEIVKELMVFKNHAGEFVTRRMNGFLRGCEKKGWSHHDDLSMAAIYTGE